jgi:hypothetical protein
MISLLRPYLGILDLHSDEHIDVPFYGDKMDIRWRRALLVLLVCTY